jgi:hypothetical protein
LLASRDFETSKHKLAMALGKTIGGEPVDRRYRQDAASARRRHHRLGQVGRDQHHDPVDPLPAEAGGVPADHDRPENARALRL